MPFYRFLNDEADMVTGHDWEELDETDSDQEPLGPESSPSPPPPSLHKPLIIDIPSAESDDEEISHEQAESRRDRPGEPDKRDLSDGEAEPRLRETFPGQRQIVRETDTGTYPVTYESEVRDESPGDLVSSVAENDGLFRDEEQAEMFRRQLISGGAVHRSGEEQEVDNNMLKQRPRGSLSAYVPPVGRKPEDNALQRSEDSSRHSTADVSEDGEDFHSDPFEVDIVHEWTSEAQRLRGLANGNITNSRVRDETDPVPLMPSDVSDDEEEDLTAIGLPFVQSDIPDEDIKDETANVWPENKRAQTIPLKRRPSTSMPPQLPLHYACQFCRARNRRCDGYVPCAGCVESGIGHKCVYRGGRGGGAISAKALGIKPAVRVKVSNAGSRYQASHARRLPSAIPVASVSQRPPPSGSRSVTSRSRQHLSAKSRSLASSTLARAPQSSPRPPRSGRFGVAKRPTRPKVQMVNADPEDIRLVICEPCRRGHSRCDGMLPCQRCSESPRYKGAQCVYRTGQYVSVGSTKSEAAASSVSLQSAPALVNGLVPDLTSRPGSHKQHEAATSPDEWSDADSDSEIDGDIAHEEELDDEEEPTIEVAPTGVPVPSPARRNGIPPPRQYAGGTPRLRDTDLPGTTHKYCDEPRRRKRAACEDSDIGHSLSRQKRVKLGPPETTQKPSSGAGKRALGRDVEDRPITRSITATSTARRRSSDDEGDGHDPAVAEETMIRPEHVPSTIRQVFANLEHDIVLDIMPDLPSCGRHTLQGLGTKTKMPWAYSTKPAAVKKRELSENRSDLAMLLDLRERADQNALHRLVRNLQQDPDVHWDLMTVQEQEQLKKKRFAEVMAQREQEGRSANQFMQRVIDLVISCVGEKALFGFLLQSRRAKQRVLGLLEEFCRLDEDGKLRLVAGGNGDAAAG